MSELGAWHHFDAPLGGGFAAMQWNEHRVARWAQAATMLVERSILAFSCAPHLYRGGMGVWFTAPAGALVQFQAPVRGTVELANWLVQDVYAELERRFAARGALIFVFDLTLMSGRSAAARSIFLAKARQVGRRFGRGYVVPPRCASAAQRCTLRAGVELIRAIGVPVEVVDSAHTPIRVHGLRPLD